MSQQRYSDADDFMYDSYASEGVSKFQLAQFMYDTGHMVREKVRLSLLGVGQRK